MRRTIGALSPLVVGKTVVEFAAHPGAAWQRITGDSQWRWVEPEKA